MPNGNNWLEIFYPDIEYERFYPENTHYTHQTIVMKLLLTTMSAVFFQLMMRQRIKADSEKFATLPTGLHTVGYYQRLKVY